MWEVWREGLGGWGEEWGGKGEKGKGVWGEGGADLGDAAGRRPHVLPVHQDVHGVVGAAPHAQTVPHLREGMMRPPRSHRTPLGTTGPISTSPSSPPPQDPHYSHKAALWTPIPPSMPPKVPKAALNSPCRTPLHPSPKPPPPPPLLDTRTPPSPSLQPPQDPQ